MDVEKKYFYVPVRFNLVIGGIEFKKIDDNIYKNIATGEQFRKRLMYDYGWGQENGLELLPPLSFEDLIELVEHKYSFIRKKWHIFSEKKIIEYGRHKYNLIGAVSVIMQDHIEELIDFLSEKINTDYFDNSDIRENFKWFSFSSQKEIEAGRIPGGILKQSYEDVLNQYPKWLQISSRVTELVYRENDIY